MPLSWETPVFLTITGAPPTVGITWANDPRYNRERIEVMIKNIKVLGLAAAALFAMSALTASGAQAAKLSTESGGSTVIEADQVEGAGGHVFTVDGNKVTCTTAHFFSVAKEPAGSETAVEVNNGATTITMHPKYENCTAFGFVGATVTTTGCNYTLTAPGTISEPAMEIAASLSVECSGTHEIVISAGGVCTAKVKGQTISSGLSYVNTTVSPMTVMLNAKNAPVKTNKTQDGFGCPFNGTGEVTGEYSGETTAKGKTTGITIVN